MPQPFDLHRFIVESNKIDRQFDENKQLIPGAAPGEPMYDRHLAAWSAAIDLFASTPIPNGVWLAIHRELTRGLLIFENRNWSGKYRKAGVTIGSEEAPPAFRVRPFIEETLVPRMNEWACGIVPKRMQDERAWWVHNYFECVHPFDDGNGRVGRTGMNAMRMRLGIEPIVICKSHVQHYYKRIRKFRAESFWYAERKEDQLRRFLEGYQAFESVFM